jgi:hypothetical protein
MSAVVLLLAVGAGFGLVAAAAWWLCGEGIRQGDEPDDAVTSVTLFAQPDGVFTVNVLVTNPGMIPVVASATTRWAGRLSPVSASGRSTRRTYSEPLSDRLVAVDGRNAAALSWSVAAPPKPRRLVVDVHVWQKSDRLRRHRSVLSTEARPKMPASAGELVP